MSEKEPTKAIETVEQNAASNDHNENMSTTDDIHAAGKDTTARATSVPGEPLTTKEAISLAQAGGWEADALIEQLDKELAADPRLTKKGIFDLEFANPKYFTYILVAFASMGGLLSGLDQSLISGANLFLPDDLHLSTHQNSLVNAGMPLGAVAGAFILSPCNEYFGRKWSIIISCILYTIGGALEAGAMNYQMIVWSRVILGMGVGLEGGTVPVYVAETVERRMRGNMVSLYQFNIALGEVLGYAVAAMFVSVPGNWRYILGSSLVFSTIMGIGMLYMPESPRWLLHKHRTLDAYKVFKRIRGSTSIEAREEFFIMKVSTEQEQAEVAAGAGSRKAPWLDLFTKPRARRALVYANMMIFLGQFTGINVSDFLSFIMLLLLTHISAGHHVLHVRPHEPNGLRQVPIQLHVPSRRRRTPPWYHSSHLPHGNLRATFLGHRHVTLLLCWTCPDRSELSPPGRQLCFTRSLLHWPHHLRVLLRVIRVPYVGRTE